VHIGDKIIPGALEACQKLVQHNVAVRFLTNTTKASRQELLENLWALGFSQDLVHADSIVTNTQASKQMIRKHKLKPYCFVNDSLLADLEIEQLPNAADNNSESYDSVLVGLAPEVLNYEKLNTAFRVITKEKERRKSSVDSQEKQQPPLIIALHRGKYLRDVDGGLSLGPGGFVACLQEASGISDSDIPVMGKPSREFFLAAIPEGILSAETAMVGDDVLQDVIGAQQAGLGLGILVKTGKYQAGDEGTEADGFSPSATVDSIVEAVDYILARIQC